MAGSFRRVDGGFEAPQEELALRGQKSPVWTLLCPNGASLFNLVVEEIPGFQMLDI